MRQIYPQKNRPVGFPEQVSPEVTIDLRESPEQVLDAKREQLCEQLEETRREIATRLQVLRAIVDRRENLKLRIAELALSAPAAVGYDEDDRSVVPWGFCDD